jgi:hypothetical protein
MAMATAEAIVRPDVSAGKDADVRGVAARREPKRAAAKEPVADSPACSGEDRYRMIAEAAYYRAESRGFAGGSDLEDWLAAEMEIDQILGAVESIDDA